MENMESLQADDFDRDVFLHAPAGWGPLGKKRAWRRKAPAYGLNDAPAAFRRSLKRYLLNSELSMRCVSPRRQASAFDPSLFFVFRNEGQAVGAFTTHVDDIPGCGEPDVLAKIRNFQKQRF